MSRVDKRANLQISSKLPLKKSKVSVTSLPPEAKLSVSTKTTVSTETNSQLTILETLQCLKTPYEFLRDALSITTFSENYFKILIAMMTLKFSALTELYNLIKNVWCILSGLYKTENQNEAANSNISFHGLI